MGMVRIIVGYAAALATGFLLSAAALTQQTLSGYQGLEIGAGDAWRTFLLNVEGLSVGSPFIIILGVALIIAFLIASLLKRVLTPLAPVAYIVAGAVATPLLFVIVENVVIGGNVGAFFGARSLVGLLFQAVAGAGAGLVFTALAVRRR